MSKKNDPKIGHNKKSFLNKPVEHIDITSFDSRKIIDGMKKMSFTSRDTANAANIFNEMLSDDKCSIFLTLAGSTSAAGCMQLYSDLVKYNMVDAIVATGASIIDMDFFEALGFKHYQGSQFQDDKELRNNYIDRIYDTYIDEEELQACDKTICDVANSLKPKTYTSREFIKELGKFLNNNAKKGSLATSAKILEDLALTGHKFPNLVIEWRQVSKLKSTYTDALQEHINDQTKRVHTSFLLAATNTGRLASSDPNLQNIPIKTNDGRDIRKAFVAENDSILISADYNQIEMRILADMADVKELKKAFKNEQDIHAITASQVFGVPINKVNDDHRRKAKAINFGIIYGITQYGLAKQISVSNQDALNFINAYFKKFPEIKDYMNTTIRSCRKNGFVTNIFGRRIHLRGINDKNFSVRSFQERAAINAPIQGSAADIIRLAMIKIDKILEKNKDDTKMLLQIHDELIFECRKKKENKIKKIIKDSMESVSSSEHHMFSIPLQVSISSGNNWGDAH